MAISRGLFTDGEIMNLGDLQTPARLHQSKFFEAISKIDLLVVFGPQT